MPGQCRAESKLLPGPKGGHFDNRNLAVTGGFVESGSDIAIAKSFQRELAAVDHGQELGVGGTEGIERPVLASCASR
jgi:hypothetical protein